MKDSIETRPGTVFEQLPFVCRNAEGYLNYWQFPSGLDVRDPYRVGLDYCFGYLTWFEVNEGAPAVLSWIAAAWAEAPNDDGQAGFCGGLVHCLRAAPPVVVNLYRPPCPRTHAELIAHCIQAQLWGAHALRDGLVGGINPAVPNPTPEFASFCQRLTEIAVEGFGRR